MCPVLAPRLAPQFQSFDEVFVPFLALLFGVVEQPAALSDHDQKASARMKVLLVCFQMFRQILDPFGKDRNLHFR